MNGYSCENCRKFSPGTSPAPGWIIVTEVARTTEEEPVFLFRPSTTSELVGTYCSQRCCLEHLYARWVIGESTPAAE